MTYGSHRTSVFPSGCLSEPYKTTPTSNEDSHKVKTPFIKVKRPLSLPLSYKSYSSTLIPSQFEVT